MMARNWDDFLQRDMKAITFPRAFTVFMLNTIATFTVLKWSRLLLPVGKFGIRNVTQTSLYYNFGPLGVIGAGGIAFAGKLKDNIGVYTWWKTFKFTAHKFYRHVLMQDRNWLLEGQRISKYG